jgi:putative effector of murein hydrolase
MINDFFQSNPVSGLLLTLGCYWIGQAFYNKTGWTFFQPILTASVIIISFLYLAKIPYDVYYEQNAVLNYILPLTAVALAVPLYRSLDVLKRHALPILAGIAAGTVSHAIGTARAFQESEAQGSMGSLAIAAAGVLTALLTPVFILFLK